MVVAISEEMQRDQAAVPDIGPARVLPAHPAPEAVPAMMDDARAGRGSRSRCSAGPAGAPQGRAAIRDFLLANDLPVAVSFRRQGLFDGTSPNFVGDLGVGADAALVAKARECDLFLAIGTRMGEPVSQGYTLLDMAGAHADRAGLPGPGRDRPRLPPRARHRLRPQRLRRRRPRRPAGGEPALGRLDARAARGARGAGGGAGVRRPARTSRARCRRWRRSLPPDTIFTTDAGNFATWPTRFMHVGEGQEFLGPTNGAMGYGVPAAIGAAIVHPGPLRRRASSATAAC